MQNRCVSIKSEEKKQKYKNTAGQAATRGNINYRYYARRKKLPYVRIVCRREDQQHAQIKRTRFVTKTMRTQKKTRR